jgi:hypothetical protein
MKDPVAIGRGSFLGAADWRGWRGVAAITLAFLPAGCLTARATEPEKPRYCDDAPKTELREAATSPTAVFLQFETRSTGRKIDGRKIDGRRVMRIPLADSPGRTASPRVGSMASGPGAAPTDAVVRDVSGWFLPPGSLIPPDADPLPIFTLEDAARHSNAAPGNVQVLSMSRVLAHGGDGADSRTISAKSLARADPVIAILLKRDAGSTAALLVADVHEGCEHEKGWYALTPLAVTGETDLLAAGHLLLSGLWRD